MFILGLLLGAAAIFFILRNLNEKKLDEQEEEYKIIVSNLKAQIHKMENANLRLKEIDDDFSNLISKQTADFAQMTKDEQAKVNQKIAEIYKQAEQRKFEIISQMDAAITEYSDTIDSQYDKVEEEYDQMIKERRALIKQANKALEEIKSKLSAAVQARLREEELESKMNFYKIEINNRDLKDIQELEKIKDSIYNPDILAKLIWTTYFQKATNDLCNRVLGTKIKCGIYKITNRENEKCYIGQSVNIADRWKSHIKCGLGIDASSTNKLYNEMQKYGVWNFTFELLEECNKADLNEREKFWISMYQADKFGLNSTRGGS